MRLADLGREVVLRERGLDAADEIAAIGVIIRLLQLAPATFGKMPARRLLVVRARRKLAIVEQRITRNAERDVAAA